MKKNLPGQTLIILLIVAMIVALLVFGKMGFYTNLMGTKEKPGALKIQVNDMETKVNNYNNQVNTQGLDQ